MKRKSVGWCGGAGLLVSVFGCDQGSYLAETLRDVDASGGSTVNTRAAPEDTTSPPSAVSLPRLLLESPAGSDVWELAPARKPVGVGTTLRFKVQAFPGVKITWQGAEEAQRNASDSIADCPLHNVGAHVVGVTIAYPGGATRQQNCTLDVVDAPLEAIRVQGITAGAIPSEDRGGPLEREGMRPFFGHATAAVRDLGDGHYRTSIDTIVMLRADVEPAHLASLVEWRVNDLPLAVGATAYVTFSEPGRYTVSAGAGAASKDVVIETYRVRITSHTDDTEVIPTGRVTTLVAVTEPPGYEQDITWLAASKYGAAVPSVGSGPTFRVRFDDTWGPHPFTGEQWQWLGVQADNAEFKQQQRSETCSGNAEDCALLLGPIPGFTTAWHPAPMQTDVPRGTRLQLKQLAPAGATVVWSGATESDREPSASRSERRLDTLGEHVVRATVSTLDGRSWENVRTFNVVDHSADELVLGPILASVNPLAMRDPPTNQETMHYFFGESIAALRPVGPNAYRTSIDRQVLLTATVEPAGFTPLVEWRIVDQPPRLGRRVGQSFREVGHHTVVAGPPGKEQRVIVETYGVTITSHVSDEDFVPEDQEVVFQAITDPPGYENEITWLSSTQYGTTSPAHGQGPTLIAKFNDTWGPLPEGGLWQWLGVKADQATFEQDAKEQVCTADVFDDPPVQVYERLFSTSGVGILVPTMPDPILQVAFAPPIDVEEPFAPFTDFRTCVDTSGSLELIGFRPGTYIVRVTTASDTQLYSWCVDGGIFEGVTVETFGSGEQKKKQREGRYSKIATPTGDIVLVEQNQPGDNKANDKAFNAYQAANQNPVRFPSMNTAVTAIGNRFNQLGRRISVVIHGHGSAGSMSVGGGQAKEVNTAQLLAIGKDRRPAGTLFVCKVKGKITTLELMGCNVARDASAENGYDGRCFLQDLADCLSEPGANGQPDRVATIQAYDRSTCASANIFGARAQIQVVVDGPNDTPANHSISRTGNPARPCPYVDKCTWRVRTVVQNGGCVGGTNGCRGGCPFYVGQEFLLDTQNCNNDAACANQPAPGQAYNCRNDAGDVVGTCTVTWESAGCAQCNDFP